MTQSPDVLAPPEIVDRPFGSFRVGETASLAHEVTAQMIDQFAAVSGDRNPLHTSDDYARTTRYQRRVAHGLLASSPISALAGHLLPGKRCVLLEVSARFSHPVFPGDRLTYRGTITHLSEAMRVLRVDVQVTNQDGVVVLKGAYQAQVLEGSS